MVGEKKNIQEQAGPTEVPITVSTILNPNIIQQDVLHPIMVVPNVFRRSWTILRSISRRGVNEKWEEICGASTAEMFLGPK